MLNNKECYVCKTNLGLHVHHVIPGVAGRKKCDEYGLTIYLCGRHHNLSNVGVHFNKELDLEIRKLAQTEFEKTYTRDLWIKEFGKSYL